MGRRRKADNGTAVAEPNGVHAEGQPEPVKTKPVASFAASTDRTTRVEVAVWARQVKTDDGEFTQYSFTMKRTWRDQAGSYKESGFYRAHDWAVLTTLLSQAHSFIVWQRTTANVPQGTEDELPF